MFHPTLHHSSSSPASLLVSPTCSSNPLHSSPPLLPRFKVGSEMECVEAALKSSFRGDVASGKAGLVPSFEDFCGVGSGSGLGVGPCEDFLVDELLDFSNEDELVEEDMEMVNELKDGGTGLLSGVSSTGESTAKDELAVVPAGELSVPAEELASLEWLSHFVEDSFSGFSSPFPAGVSPGKTSFALKEKEGTKPEVTEAGDRAFKTPAHARARRSHRSRAPGGKGWSPSLSDTSSSGSSSSSYNSTTSDTVTMPNMEAADAPARKRTKWGNYGSGPGQAAARRCSHCRVQKTPQWRAGPLGSKTLCNACGVRFKSGRLFPEYRPACSPTFSSELHSNHHRKVLEMRRKKESSLLGRAEAGLAVPSF